MGTLMVLFWVSMRDESPLSNSHKGLWIFPSLPKRLLSQMIISKLSNLTDDDAVVDGFPC